MASSTLRVRSAPREVRTTKASPSRSMPSMRSPRRSGSANFKVTPCQKASRSSLLISLILTAPTSDSCTGAVIATFCRG